MESAKTPKKFPDSKNEENPLLELAFDNTCFHLLIKNIMDNASQKNITKEEEEKYFLTILEKYEKQMLYNQKEKSIFVQKYLKIKDINLLTEELCTNYLINDLSKYIGIIFQINKNIFKYIIPLLLFISKENYDNYHKMIKKLNDEKNGLSNQIKSLEKKLEKKIEELSFKNNKEIEELKKINNRLDKEIQKNHQENKILKKEIEKIKEKHKEDMKKLESRIIKKNYDITKIKEKQQYYYEENKKAHEDLMKEISKNKELSKNNEKKIKEYESKIKFLEEELNNAEVLLFNFEIFDNQNQ